MLRNGHSSPVSPLLRAVRGAAGLALCLLLAGCSAPAPPATPAPTEAPPAPTATVAPTATAIPATAPAATASPAATPAPTPGAAPELARTLQLEDPPLEGDDVRQVQQRLLDLGYAPGEADGVYGERTERAVRAFQFRNGLEVDGVVGPLTWGQLFDPGALAAPSIVPIVDAGTGWLLGGVSDGAWVSPEQTARQVGPALYRVYDATGEVGAATGGAPASLGVPCEATLDVELDPAPQNQAAVALGGEANPLPRPVVAGDPESPELRERVAGLLRANGIAEPDVRITAVVLADLDGDGSEEQIVNATRYANAEPGAPPTPDAAAGDYSLLVVYRGGAERPSSIAEEYYPEAREFNAPSDYRLSGVLDLNGDGVMEIVVSSRYYEGAYTGVFTLAGAGFAEVLGAGCGV